VPIENDYQRDVLIRAKLFLENPNNSMTPKDYNFKQWRNHYYYVCHEVGISRKDGITSHGLRHERFNGIYLERTGQPSPVKGGVACAIDAYTHEMARQEIAEVAGHSRESISGAYIGN
jgi:integrase